MGAPTRAPPHLCRLLLPAGVFLLLLLLLHLTSPRFPGLPPLACVWGPRTRFQEVPLDHEDKETVGTRPDCGARPHGPTEATALLPAATNQLPPPPLPPGTAGALLPPTPAGPQGQFQIQRLRSAFAASISPDGQVLLADYLRGWDELIRLLDALGAAFRLISAEAEAKTGLLRGLRAGRDGRHYRTLQGMVAFEHGPGRAPWGDSEAPRGLRTLLLLHRALRWLQLFLRGLAEGEADAAPARLCAEAYRVALAPFHAWWVRRAAALAFLALPARPELLRLACAGAGPGARDVLRSTVRTLEHVYNVTQDIYAAHGLLELP